MVRQWALIGLFTLFQVHGFSAVNQNIENTGTTDNRTQRRLGVVLGLLGNGFSGVGVGYNALEFLRVDATFGLGWASSLGWRYSTVLGPTFLVPKWNISPTLGLHWAADWGDGRLARRFLLLSLGGLWQLTSGFSVGAGWGIPLQSGLEQTPYLRIGMFF